MFFSRPYTKVEGIWHKKEYVNKNSRKNVCMMYVLPSLIDKDSEDYVKYTNIHIYFGGAIKITKGFNSQG